VTDMGYTLRAKEEYYKELFNYQPMQIGYKRVTKVGRSQIINFHLQIQKS
jgi:hypothetical protein